MNANEEVMSGRLLVRSGIRVLVFEDRTEVWTAFAGEPIVLRPGQVWRFEVEAHERGGRIADREGNDEAEAPGG